MKEKLHAFLNKDTSFMFVNLSPGKEKFLPQNEFNPTCQVKN
jgi:hypothetical protein